MPIVVAVTVGRHGAIRYYEPADLPLGRDDMVVIDTPQGAVVGRVVQGPRNVPYNQLPAVLLSVTRLATDYDLERHHRREELELRAPEVVVSKIEYLDLPMKLVEVQADPDADRIIVYFAAEGRVDFRTLVRELSEILGVRVHMHQIGARDHARIIGGIGSCGRETCCRTWMQNFEPVSMRMAKDQSLFLNPAKFSGSCGKLKCCLRYEYEGDDDHDHLDQQVHDNDSPPVLPDTWHS
ncbi:MAG: stage 0 sporulation protein [Armatimonadetes bacterium]|jgi:cell fate regulator YaaT (PSP1 superfamily)|nr:stage 0 sporulation protein [Armatimonadota bacterium]